jgi:predicted acetyltransferase
MFTNMADQELNLVSPSADHESSFCEMNDEFERQEGNRFREFESFGDFLKLLDRQAQEPLQADRVPMSTYWLIAPSGRILGELRIRHYLNETLEHEGGHIGYHIRPSERGKGYGTIILRKGLELARSRGITRVVVTCDSDNLPSARIIEKHGGQFDSQGVSSFSGKPISRYRIDL